MKRMICKFVFGNIVSHADWIIFFLLSFLLLYTDEGHVLVRVVLYAMDLIEGLLFDIFDIWMETMMLNQKMFLVWNFFIGLNTFNGLCDVNLGMESSAWLLILWVEKEIKSIEGLVWQRAMRTMLYDHNCRSYVWLIFFLYWWIFKILRRGNWHKIIQNCSSFSTKMWIAN